MLEIGGSWRDVRKHTHIRYNIRSPQSYTTTSDNSRDNKQKNYYVLPALPGRLPGACAPPPAKKKEEKMVRNDTIGRERLAVPLGLSSDSLRSMQRFSRVFSASLENPQLTDDEKVRRASASHPSWIGLGDSPDQGQQDRELGLQHREREQKEDNRKISKNVKESTPQQDRELGLQYHERERQENNKRG